MGLMSKIIDVGEPVSCIGTLQNNCSRRRLTKSTIQSVGWWYLCIFSALLYILPLRRFQFPASTFLTWTKNFRDWTLSLCHLFTCLFYIMNTYNSKKSCIENVHKPMLTKPRTRRYHHLYPVGGPLCGHSTVSSNCVPSCSFKQLTMTQKEN